MGGEDRLMEGGGRDGIVGIGLRLTAAVGVRTCDLDSEEGG